MTTDGPSQEISSAPGVVEVSLPESPTTGFLWRLAGTPSGVVEAGSEYLPGSNGSVGGSGTRVFRLQIESPGRYELEFHLGRSWTNQAIERRSVVVNVG